MAVIRVKKNKNYTTMSNVHLRDQELSLKAKGLLSLILSLPDDWNYSVNGLTANVKEGRGVVLSALRELELHGYVYREQSRDIRGRMGKIEYLIYEHPSENPRWNPQLQIPQSKNPTTEKSTAKIPMSEIPQSKREALLSTDIQKKEETNHREKKELLLHLGSYHNVCMTDEEYQQVQREFPMDYSLRIDRLSEYMASTGKTYQNHLATIRSWARREQKAVTRPHPNGYSHSAYYDYEEDDSL